jgi:group II intron reverse transcriptase/maturase
MNIGEMQRKLALWAIQEQERKFKDLYHLLYNKDWITEAHDHVRKNAGSKTAGLDGITMKDFDEDLDRNIEKLRQDLKAQTFEPLPVRRVYIPKPGGKKRPLGIPAIKDRIVQEALRMILEPIFESDFSQYSYGFRPNRCTKDAIAYIGARLKPKNGNYYWVIEGDIASFFDTIKHRKLIKLVRRRIKDRKVLDLIWKFLRAGVMERNQNRETLTGTPQGGIISPLLANVYLTELDKYMEQYLSLLKYERRRRRTTGQANYLYVRYADDFVVLCNGTKEQALEMQEELYEFLRTLGLTLSLEKTKITHVNDGFKFLGFWIERSIGQSGECVPRIRIPHEAYKRIKHKVLETLSPSTCSHSAKFKIQQLNRIIDGWCRYYQHTSSPSAVFTRLNYDVWWAMAHWLGRKYKCSIPRVCKQFLVNKHFATKTSSLKMPNEYTAKRYPLRAFSHPYLATSIEIEREELFSPDDYRTVEAIAGQADRKDELFTRRQSCNNCGKPLSFIFQAELDHKKPRLKFKRPENADYPANQQILCIPCHKLKTSHDQRVLSRVR